MPSVAQLLQDEVVPRDNSAVDNNVIAGTAPDRDLGEAWVEGPGLDWLREMRAQ